MKFKLLILLGIFSGAALPALADSYSATPFLWTKDTPSHQEYKKYNPYLENGKETQNQQWANEDWYVQDWTSQSPEGDQALIDGFYRSDILREQKIMNGKAAVVVGANFYRLGGLDKRRVMTTLDAVYGVTENSANPTILLYDWKTDQQIGYFGKDGLVLE